MEDLHIYPSKIKNIFFLLLAGTGAVLFGILTISGLIEGVWIAVLLGALPFLVFGFASYRLFFGVFRLRPYLTLTENELIIRAFAKKDPIPIKWEDILGYNLITNSGKQTVEIWLYNEEEYDHLLSAFNQFSTDSFTIAWGQVKRKDRKKLAYELDRRAFGDTWGTKEDPVG